MFSLLIALIYLAFISVGLPDSLLGSAWPVISEQFGVDKGMQGLVTMLIAGGTIVSSLMSDFLTKKIGTALVTATSVLLTAVALLGFSTCNALWQMCLWAIPYGLSAGAVDAALNNYAAVHFSSRHLNWLHCFWGVGCCISPYIMGTCLGGDLGWTWGYRIVSFIQIAITAVLFCSLPLWKKVTSAQSTPKLNNCAVSDVVAEKSDDVPGEKTDTKPAGNVFAIRGVWQTLVMFFCYCSAESIAMMWSSSYLVFHRGVSESLAATFASLFFIGITSGRFVCGLVSDKLGDRKLISIGIAVMTAGVVAIALPLRSDVLALGGLVVFGFGCAPVYPAIIHSTPSRFGEANSQKIVGLQMASAYLDTTFMPPLFGLTSTVAMWAFPLFLGGFTLLLFVMSVYSDKISDKICK